MLSIGKLKLKDMINMALSKADRKKIILALAERTNSNIGWHLVPYLIDFHNEILREGKGLGFSQSEISRNTRCGSCLKQARATVLFYYHNHMDKYKELEYQDRSYGRYNEPVYKLV